MIRLVRKLSFYPCGLFRAVRLVRETSLVVLAICATAARAGTLEDALARFDAERPRSIEALTPIDPATKPDGPVVAPQPDGSIVKAGLAGVAPNLPVPGKTARRDSAAAVDEAAAELIRGVQSTRPDVVLAQVERLLAAKAQVDAGLAELFALRTSFAAIPPTNDRRPMLRNYLQAISRSIDLAGRLRYLEFDVFNTASAQLAAQVGSRQKLIELFLKYRNSVGAIAMAGVLDDPATGGATAAQPASIALRSKVLELIARTGETECLPALAGFVVRPGVPPALVLQGVETIRSIGLPQDIHPGQDPTLPTPAITASRLHQVVTRLNLRGAQPNCRSVAMNWPHGSTSASAVD